ncbi:MAG: ISL3 family transposase [Oscillospiraceae bacterium]|nr:ISL3 family transposase [Oscillospiraceae bacterium]
MLMTDYTSKLLNLEDVIITNVENIADQLHIYLELPRRAHTCPACGATTDRIHDYRMQTIKDIPLARDTFLHLRKRRYRCSCGKRFFEKNTFLPRYYRVTSRLVAEIMFSFKKLVPAKEIGCRFNVSAVTAMRYFNLFNKKPTALPEVISLDEFKGNSGGQKYNSVVADPKNKTVIDILPNRYENDLVKYFSQFSNKNQVKYFVCDMNPHFRQVAKTCFPKAVIVADKYHVVRQVYWAMERVRKNEQNKLSTRFRKYFKKSRYLLSKPIEKLTEDEMDRLSLMFEIAPRLADAYRLKNEFLTVIRSKSSVEGRQKLADWLLSVEVMQLPEFHDCTKAYHNWFNEILNSMDVPWTNGYIEGCNNKTKVLKRVCFGMRNFNNFRKRILFCNT